MPITRRELAIRGAPILLGPWLATAPGPPGSKALRALGREVRGPLLVPGRAGYGAVAHGYNERYDARRPAAVLIARDVADVQAAVRWAAAHRVPIAARSGGHSYAGYSTVSKGLVVDLRRLRGIRLERNGTRAVIGAGARLGDIYARLAARGVTVP